MILGFTGNSVFGQTYRLVDKDRTMTFARLTKSGFQDSIYYFMKTDSFDVSGTDTTFFFNTQLRTPVPAAPECDFVFNDSVLLGQRMLVKNDPEVTHVFFNANNDSIFIKSNIFVGKTWRVYTWADGSYIKGTVINRLEQEFLPGVLDSFYRIKLNVYSPTNVLQPTVFPNETKIDISKNNGIIEFFNFNLFPLPGDSLGRVLRGLSDPDAGVVDVDAQTAFTFKTGYEFHYREELAPDPSSGADKRISAIKYFVMDAEIGADHATYTMERVQFDTLYTGITPSSTIIWDTIDVTYNFADYGFLDSIEFTVFENLNFGYSDFIKADTLFTGISHKYVYDNYTFDPDTRCLNNIDELFNPKQIYGEGLGIIYYLDSTDAEHYHLLEMQYYQQGLNTWGTPFDFSALDLPINNLVQANSIVVFPNPCEDILHLKNIESGIIRIYNTGGVLIMQQQVTNNIDVSELPVGIYLLEIKDGKHSAYTTFSKR